LNKAELVSSIAQKAEMSKKDAEKALNGFTESVEETLEKGEKVQLVGFGSFEVRERAARKGINPQTKEEITIEASKVPVFRVGKAFRDKINNV
jgi:DNA-binding protein HU-beta